MKCRMSGGHSANTGNTAKIHRLCCSSIENSYWKKMNKVYHYCKFGLERYLLCPDKGHEYVLMNKNINSTVKITTPVHECIWCDM